MQRFTRRTFIAGTSVATLALAGCLGDDGDDDDGDDTVPPGDDDDNGDDTVAPGDDDYDDDHDDHDDDEEPEPLSYEIWAADQGTDQLYIYEGTEGSDNLELLDTYDLSTNGGRPHMVHFTSDYAYAAIANAGGPVIMRTEDREIIAEPETGGGTHFAGFSPDDEWLIVDVIGDNKIVRIDVDLDNESFDIADELVPSDEVEDIADTQNPVCHSWDHNGRTIHTLGPGYGDGGVVIVDHESFEIDVAWPGDELQANCGTMPHPTEDKFYLTAGLPSNPDEDVEGIGKYYVLDTSTDEIIAEGDSGGIDAHGFWFTTDGEELWVLNRETNDGIILDPDSDEVTGEIDAFGPDESDSPDIMWATPDGAYMVATLRGPNPVTGSPHAATGVNPGFSLLDVESKEIVSTIVPDEEDEDSDFHGVGVRPLGDAEGWTSPPF